MSGASVCLSAPWLFSCCGCAPCLLRHLSFLSCLKDWFIVGYFWGFLHKSDTSNKGVLWWLHWSYNSTFVDYFPRFSCKSTQGIFLIWIVYEPLASCDACFMFHLCWQCLLLLSFYPQISVLSSPEIGGNKLSLIYVSTSGFPFKRLNKAISSSNAVYPIYLYFKSLARHRFKVY